MVETDQRDVLRVREEDRGVRGGQKKAGARIVPSIPGMTKHSAAIRSAGLECFIQFIDG